MSYRVAYCIPVLFAQLQAGAPAAAPPATPVDSWGTIGDAAHDPSSDHSPKDFRGWGNDIVTAGDIPHAPALGLDSRQVCEDIRRSRDERVKYMISQDEICSSYATSSRDAWEWGPYNPNDPHRDPHDTHAHISVVGDARADGTQPWATIGGDEESMGQSFGPIEILRDEPTSLALPPTRAGAADPRPAWLRINNDTGGRPGVKVAPDYHLRLVASNGKGGWRGLGPGGAMLVTFKSGVAQSFELHEGEDCVSIQRCWTDESGKPFDPASGEMPERAQVPYDGHLTCCVERGAVAH